MPLPWNRDGRDDSSDSWVAQVPIVGRVLAPRSGNEVDERSAPTVVAAPGVPDESASTGPTGGEPAGTVGDLEADPDDREVTARP